MEPERQRGVQEPVRRLNWTTIALIAGLILVVLLVAYFATRGNADQDKLTGAEVSSGSVQSREKLCANSTTYGLIKRELFRRAAQLRGSDQAAYDRLTSFAVVRMENPVMESEDSSTGAVNCSGSLSLDLPPGVAVVGGRRSLMSDVDYTIQPAADGSGNVVLLRNADAIITPLATLAKVGEPAPAPAATPDENAVAPERLEPNVAESEIRGQASRSADQLRRPAELRLRSGAQQGRDRRLLGQRLVGTRRQHGDAIPPCLVICVAGGTRAAPVHARPLSWLSRPLPEPPVHRQFVCRAHARDPRHYGRPLAIAAVSGGENWWISSTARFSLNLDHPIVAS